MKIGFSALVLTALCCASSLSAQTPAAGGMPASADVETLLRVSKVQEMVESMSANMEKQLGENLRHSLMSQRIPAEVVDEALKAEADYLKEVRNDMSWDNLKAAYIKAFGESYSPEEIKGLIDFYQTPLGKAFAEKQPQANQKALEAVQGKMQALAPKIQKTMSEAVAKAMIKSAKAAPAPAPAAPAK